VTNMEACTKMPSGEDNVAEHELRCCRDAQVKATQVARGRFFLGLLTHRSGSLAEAEEPRAREEFRAGGGDGWHGCWRLKRLIETKHRQIGGVRGLEGSGAAE